MLSGKLIHAAGEQFEAGAWYTWKETDSPTGVNIDKPSYTSGELLVVFEVVIGGTPPSRTGWTSIGQGYFARISDGGANDDFDITYGSLAGGQAVMIATNYFPTSFESSNALGPSVSTVDTGIPYAAGASAGSGGDRKDLHCCRVYVPTDEAPAGMGLVTDVIADVGMDYDLVTWQSSIHDDTGFYFAATTSVVLMKLLDSGDTSPGGGTMTRTPSDSNFVSGRSTRQMFNN